MNTKAIIPAMIALSLAACSGQTLAQDDADSHGHSHAPDGSHYIPGDVQPAMTIAATPNSPEYIQLANNVEIIESVSEAMNSGSATFTHEGYFGPLLFGEELRAYTLRLEPGMRESIASLLTSPLLAHYPSCTY